MFQATFHIFKPSGKWYASGRGQLPLETFKTFTGEAQRAVVLLANDRKMPGITGHGANMRVVVIPDDDHPSGWPLCWEPMS